MGTCRVPDICAPEKNRVSHPSLYFVSTSPYAPKILTHHPCPRSRKEKKPNQTNQNPTGRWTNKKPHWWNNVFPTQEHKGSWSLLHGQAIPCSLQENKRRDFYHPDARKRMKTVPTDTIRVSSCLVTAHVCSPLRQSHSCHSTLYKWLKNVNTDLPHPRQLSSHTAWTENSESLALKEKVTEYSGLELLTHPQMFS